MISILVKKISTILSAITLMHPLFFSFVLLSTFLMRSEDSDSQETIALEEQTCEIGHDDSIELPELDLSDLPDLPTPLLAQLLSQQETSNSLIDDSDIQEEEEDEEEQAESEQLEKSEIKADFSPETPIT